MMPRDFILRWSCDPKKGQGQWKLYKMVEVYGTYTHGRYEKNVVKNFACKV